MQPATRPSRKRPASPTGPKSGADIVVPHPPRWYQWAAAWLIFAAIRLVSLTLRYKWEDRCRLFDREAAAPVIYCAWHNRLVLSMTAYYKFIRKRNPTCGLAALVSASKDGAFLVAILEC